MINKLKYWVVGIVLIATIGLAGSMDYNDQVTEAQDYCASVASGQMIDYKGTYDKYCPIDKSSGFSE